MQKFREYIYVDNNRIESYINQIDELNKNITSEHYEKQTSVDGGINFKIATAGTTLNEKTSKNYSIKQSTLEAIVNWVCNEKNAINYSGKNLTTDDKDKLIILSGKMSIPEMSENLEIINSLTRQAELLNMMSISEDDKKTLSVIKESDNIPILLETDSDYLFNCNIQKNNIIGNIDDLMDTINEEINVIGRIDKIYNSNDEIEIFNLAKEILKLNRATIRRMPQENLKDAIITENGPLVKITPIIIYK